MILYECKCPICKHVNKDVDLRETDGWMECEECENLVQYPGFAKSYKIPVYSMDRIPKELLGGGMRKCI